MSTNMPRVSLSDLQTVRLRCPCGGVLEASLPAMEQKEGRFGCPMCGKSLHPPKVGDGDLLSYLFMAMVAVGKSKAVVVEFDVTPPA